MHQTCAITCLNPSIEKQSTVNPLKRRNINLVTSSIQRRLGMFEDKGEKFRTSALANASPLFNRICNFFLERLVHSRQVFTYLPRIEIEGIIHRLPKCRL